MIRVGSSLLPATGNDAIADRDRTPSSPGPFRAALRIASRSDRVAAERAHDDAATAAAQAAQQKAEAQRSSSAGSAAPAGSPGSSPAGSPTDAARDRRITAEPRDRRVTTEPRPGGAFDAGAMLIGRTITASGLRAAAIQGTIEGSLTSASSTELASVTAAAGMSGVAQLGTGLGLDPAALPSPAETTAGPPPVTTAGPALDPALAAALGLTAVPAQPQVTQVVPATQVAAAGDAPASALLAAAAGRAIGAGTRPGVTAPNTDAADAATPVASVPAPGVGTLPMTPLEQAVHDLLGRIAEPDAADVGPSEAPLDGHPDADLAPFHMLASTHVASAAHDPAAPAATTPGRAAAPIQVPEPPANPSHVHLVLEDGAERTVVTVALRGNEVHVAMRSTDDTTTSALARNAASLDHAMRARGLALAELTAEREPNHRPPPRDPEPRESRAPHNEPFELEETP